MTRHPSQPDAEDSVTQPVRASANDIELEEIRAVRERLRQAVHREASDEPHAAQSYWRQSATQWDIFKFVLPMLIAACLWCVRMEINQARNEARFDSINVTLQNQNSTLRDIQSSLKDFGDSKEVQGQRLASIEAKIDVLRERQ